MRFPPTKRHTDAQAGLTLVELLVSLAIGSFLIIGAVQIYNQSRHAFVINESIARVQETAQFAMDTIEADLRMAGSWGRTSRPLDIDGRSIAGNANPTSLTLASGATTCGVAWVLDLGTPVDGNNNTYALTCPEQAGTSAQARSDVLTIRRASAATVTPTAGRLQIQSTRMQGKIFIGATLPAGFNTAGVPPASVTHNLLVSSYYVANNSALIPGIPTLRRKTLVLDSGATVIQDQEVAPGVENLQVRFGVDINGDNAVDRYVNPGDGIYIPGSGTYVAGTRVLTARVWLVVRGTGIETGIEDSQNYAPGDVTLGTYSDQVRRLQVSKTILLRNARL